MSVAESGDGSLPGPELRTERLLLRRWRAADLEPFASLNCDPRVMEYLPKALSREESDAMVDRIEAHFERRGFGLWAVEVVDVEPFIGFVGLSVPRFEAACTPCVEVGWRLAASAWGRGYATEAAARALRFAFDELRLIEVVSFTVPDNRASLAVMERLGMVRDPAADFEHPLLPAEHRLRSHVLYRLRSPLKGSRR